MSVIIHLYSKCHKTHRISIEKRWMSKKSTMITLKILAIKEPILMVSRFIQNRDKKNRNFDNNLKKKLILFWKEIGWIERLLLLSKFKYLINFWFLVFARKSLWNIFFRWNFLFLLLLDFFQKFLLIVGWLFSMHDFNTLIVIYCKMLVKYHIECFYKENRKF